jgi:hypothetical protein
METYAAQGVAIADILTERPHSHDEKEAVEHIGTHELETQPKQETRGYSYGDVLLFVLLELACGDDLGYSAEDVYQSYDTSIYPNNPENIPLTISVSR